MLVATKLARKTVYFAWRDTDNFLIQHMCLSLETPKAVIIDWLEANGIGEYMFFASRAIWFKEQEDAILTYVTFS